MIRRLYSFYHLYDLQIIQRKFGYIFSRTVGKKKKQISLLSLTPTETSRYFVLYNARSIRQNHPGKSRTMSQTRASVVATGTISRDESNAAKQRSVLSGVGEGLVSKHIGYIPRDLSRDNWQICREEVVVWKRGEFLETKAREYLLSPPLLNFKFSPPPLARAAIPCQFFAKRRAVSHPLCDHPPFQGFQLADSENSRRYRFPTIDRILKYNYFNSSRNQIG